MIFIFWSVIYLYFSPKDIFVCYACIFLLLELASIVFFLHEFTKFYFHNLNGAWDRGPQRRIMRDGRGASPSGRIQELVQGGAYFFLSKGA